MFKYGEYVSFLFYSFDNSLVIPGNSIIVDLYRYELIGFCVLRFLYFRLVSRSKQSIFLDKVVIYLLRHILVD